MTVAVHLGVQIRLHFRNRMALIYSYIFPTIFLVAFWVLYRHETVPLVRHMGELLTVTALGGACFGLPTSLVSERERGVWRRFRLAPVRTATLVLATLVARYVLLLTAGVLQLALAMGVFGMPAPQHPVELFLAFTLVSFAFLGLGLVIAALSDNVPAVQALGQCIFLPMLVIGGVAVRIETLPAWAQHVSAYFPGRYAVESLQVTVAGDGLGGSLYALFALVAIGGAAFLAGSKLFRWDQQQRFARLPGKGWVAAAVAGWVFVGGLAQATGQVSVGVPLGSGAVPVSALFGGSTPQSGAAVGGVPAGDSTPSTPAGADSVAVASGPGDGAPGPVTAEGGAVAGEPAVDSVAVGMGEPSPDESADAPRPPEPPEDTPQPPAEPVVAEAAPTDSAGTVVEAASPAAAPPQPWATVTMAQIDSLNFFSLPPDDGIVAPVASYSEDLPGDVLPTLQCIRAMLPAWPPGQVDDPVQQVRNFLYIAAVPDMYQVEELERWIPLIVFQHLAANRDPDELMKELYWIVMNPNDGDDWGATQLHAVCLDMGAPADVETLRERTWFYAYKLLGRLAGYLEQQ
ncbi:MAG TPA: ABC transporter permease [Longimicrobiales bacterium]|nr:ABC transporter permease [Longimicrobiales bacterium]